MFAYSFYAALCGLGLFQMLFKYPPELRAPCFSPFPVRVESREKIGWKRERDRYGLQVLVFFWHRHVAFPIG